MPRQHTYKARNPKKLNATISRAREDRFSWESGGLHITYPNEPAAAGPVDSELHTVLWSLEHVTNHETMSEAMVGVAGYLIDHPNDPLVVEAIRRAEERIEQAT